MFRHKYKQKIEKETILLDLDKLNNTSKYFHIQNSKIYLSTLQVHGTK